MSNGRERARKRHQRRLQRMSSLSWRAAAQEKTAHQLARQQRDAQREADRKAREDAKLARIGDDAQRREWQRHQDEAWAALARAAEALNRRLDREAQRLHDQRIADDNAPMTGVQWSPSSGR